ncbi:hypothetical protein B0T21DRAFT_451175 [Apiosordaria backusii]|uniref:J domain-containing protein n=1 Tax=Apiosordaria backusii TaxID=314023 RepID=A0AA40BLH0_9PEZI|nr:hypothetical protein B0T21DRAFT_451175 [Apiosordaria backusii]
MATQSGKPMYYSLLGIRPDANAVEVKKGYHRMARLKHPDKHANSAAATEEFQRLHQAYEILSDPKTRYSYDQTIASEFETSAQARVRYARLLDRAQKDATRTTPSVDYKRRLLEAFELRLRQKQRAYDAEQRRILNAQAFVTISDGDSPEPTHAPRSETNHAATGQAETEVIGEMPSRVVRHFNLAKQDLQKAAADTRNAELSLKKINDDMEILQGKLRRAEKECAELEREHNPHWRDNEATRTSGQASFQPFESSHHSVSQGHPSHHQAPPRAQNFPPMSSPHGPYQASQTSSPLPSFSFPESPSGQQQHYQRPRSYSVHGGMPPPLWPFHPSPPQQPWPQPESNHHQSQYETMKAEIDRLNARNLENDKSMERLLQKNSALAEEVQRLKWMLDQANKQQASSNDGVNSATEKKRGRAEGDGSGSDDMGGKGPKAARRV